MDIKRFPTQYEIEQMPKHEKVIAVLGHVLGIVLSGSIVYIVYRILF